MTYGPPTTQTLAIDRTMLAYERTLMAWSRTSVSMTSFGFTIFSFFEQLGPRDVRHTALGPRGLAVLLSGTGTAMLLLAMWQHRVAMQELERDTATHRKSLAMSAAGVISLIGLVVVVVVMTSH